MLCGSKHPRFKIYSIVKTEKSEVTPFICATGEISKRA